MHNPRCVGFITKATINTGKTIGGNAQYRLQFVTL